MKLYWLNSMLNTWDKLSIDSRNNGNQVHEDQSELSKYVCNSEKVFHVPHV